MSDNYCLIPGYVPPEPEPKPKGRQRYRKPREMWGDGPEGETCKTCNNLCSYTQSRKWYKCGVWIQSASATTDIRLKWPACGKWEKER